MALTKDEALFDENGNGVLEPTEKQKMDQLAQYLNVDAVNTTNNAKSGTSTSTSRTKLSNWLLRLLALLASFQAQILHSSLKTLTKSKHVKLRG
jgi:hypothetical protein